MNAMLATLAEVSCRAFLKAAFLFSFPYASVTTSTEHVRSTAEHNTSPPRKL